MKIDVSIMAAPLEEVGPRVQRLSETGIDGIFTAEGPHDIFASLYLAAAQSTSLGLMTNAAIAFPRNPIHLAHSAFDLQRLSEGNFRLGIAPQVPAHITRRFGIPWSEPVKRMADLIDALHAIFDTWQNGTTLNHEGPYYSHTLMTPMFSPGRLISGPPPVLLGALGPVMTQLAAERAEGLTVLPFCSELFLRSVTEPALARGLEFAKRDRGEVELVCGAIVGIVGTDRDQNEVERNVKALLGFYGSTRAYTRVLASIGKEDVGPLLAARVREGDFSSLAEFVDDEMVSKLSIIGTPQEVAEELKQRFGWLADRLALFFPAEPTYAEVGALVYAMKN